MDDQYAITQATESGGLLRRVRVNDGPWFVRVGEESDLARLTKANAELREAAQAILDRHGPIEVRTTDTGRSYLSPAGIMIEGNLLKALYDALATLDVPEEL